jgi:hypothetical protein
MADDELRATVEAQAAAHIGGDAARFASYMTPAAVLELGRTADATRGIRPRRYRVISIAGNGEGATSEVLFSGGGSYIVRQTWQRGGAGWRALSAERPAERIKAAWWRRMLPLRRHASRTRDELE